MNHFFNWLDVVTGNDVYLIANNPKLSIEKIQAKLREDDTIIQFNKSIFAKELKHVNTNKAFIFNTRERDRKPHGFSDRLKPLFEYDPVCSAEYFMIYHERMLLNELRIPELSGSRKKVRPMDVSPVHTMFHEPGKNIRPSVGFYVATMIWLWNRVQNQGKSRSKVVYLCGFDGELPALGWVGHDFLLEQSIYQILDGMVSLDSSGVKRDQNMSQKRTEIGSRSKNVSALLFERNDQTTAQKIKKAINVLFPSGHDYAAMSVSDMAFSIAKLQRILGDQAAYESALRSAFFDDPSADPTLLQLKLVADFSRSILLKKQRKNTKKIKTSFQFSGFETKRFSRLEHLGPQAAYVADRSARRRVLVLNETSMIPYNRFHAGCDRVSVNLYEALNARGLEVAGWINGLRGLQAASKMDPLLDVDAVIINGEGTMHHDAPRALEIMMIGEHFKRRGTKVFLINTVWESNTNILNRMLKDVDLVSVRESTSLDAVRKVRSDAIMVPDLCWMTPSSKPAKRSLGNIGISDSVVDEISDTLGALAIENQTTFYVMHKFYASLRKAFISGVPRAALPKVLDVSELNNHDGWLTGRYHCAILALNAGVPVRAVSSNTRKIESMFDDIGLMHKMISVGILAETSAGIDSLFYGDNEYSEEDWRKVCDYQSMAQQSANKLFDEIAGFIG